MRLPANQSAYARPLQFSPGMLVGLKLACIVMPASDRSFIRCVYWLWHISLTDTTCGWVSWMARNSAPTGLSRPSLSGLDASELFVAPAMFQVSTVICWLAACAAVVDDTASGRASRPA